MMKAMMSRVTLARDDGIAVVGKAGRRRDEVVDERGVDEELDRPSQQVFGPRNPLNMRTSCNARISTIGDIITGTVTLSMVPILLAPETLAASSSAASMFLNAGVRSITLKAMPSPMSLTHTMPGRLKTLNGPSSMNGKAFNAVLSIPTSGSARSIHPMVVESCGNM